MVKKPIYTLGMIILMTFNSSAVWINELHYDNGGGDVGEFVEVVGAAGTDLSGWSILLYNGSNGEDYRTINLAGTILDQGSTGFGAISFEQSGIQNGPDGFALVDSAGGLIEFLSYEGSFTAVGGAADGMISMDIGVSELSTTAIGSSLQLIGSGTQASDFSWSGPTVASPGLFNEGQTFEQDGGSDSGANPVPDGGLSAVMLLAGVGLVSFYRRHLVSC